MIQPSEYSILVVDDEEMIRENVGKFLERRGFHVLMAEDGTSAFECLGRDKVDLVVSDVRMPNGDGIELIKNINDKLNGKPPVIFVTGFSSKTEREFLAMGAKAIFSKPLDRKVLLAKIESVLAER